MADSGTRNAGTWEACDRCGCHMDSRYLGRYWDADNGYWLCEYCRGIIAEWWCQDHASEIAAAREQRAQGVTMRVGR